MVFLLILTLVFIVGCSPKGDTQIDNELVNLEPKISDSDAEDIEITEAVFSEEEILVYNETIELKFIGDDVPPFEYDTYYYGYEDLPDRVYLEFKKIGINKEYPFVKYKVSSTNRYIAHIMQEKFRSLQLEYAKEYGPLFLSYGPRSGFGTYSKMPSYIKDVWLEDYFVNECENQMISKELKFGKEILYVASGECLGYNPKMKNQGMFIWNAPRYGLDLIRSEGIRYDQDIEINVEIYKVRGDLPDNFGEMYGGEDLVSECPPRTDECDQTWQVKTKTSPFRLYNFNEIEMYTYFCDYFYDETDGQTYTRYEYCTDIQEICNDYKDNDNDKLMDCDDFDCSGDVYCK